MDDTKQFLPVYENPPVIEVVCGIQFVPIGALTIGHLGRWWSLISEDFPKCDEVAPLLPVIERFKAEAVSGSEMLELLPFPRLWLTNRTGDQLIQLQKDRFLFNWRKTSEEHVYPRYNFVRSSFDKYWNEFSSFITETIKSPLRPIQYELTYINHIPADASSWGKPAEIKNVLPDVSWRSDTARFLPEPEGIDFQASFVLRDRLGRLHVRARNVQRDDNLAVILLEITARGFGDDIDKWFGVAHEYIVQGFTDLTDAEKQKELWRRTR